MRLVSCWQNDDQSEVPLFGTVTLKPEHVQATSMQDTAESATLPPPYDPSRLTAITEGITTETAKYRINVKFALFSGMDMNEISKLEKNEKTFSQLIQFLVMRVSEKKQILLSGGVFGLVDRLDEVTDELLIGKAMYVNEWESGIGMMMMMMMEVVLLTLSLLLLLITLKDIKDNQEL